MDLTPFHGPPASVPQVTGFAARTLLGFGAHGEVWLAEDLSDGVDVALKIGRSRHTGSPRRPVSELEREMAVLSRIEHPHIVRLRRVVPLPDDRLALVLDLAAGGSLASLVAVRGRLAAGEVATLLIPLIDALTHLHSRGLMHGDLAPGNVLFDGDGRPLLGDLGVAQVLGSRSAQIWSTPGFSDPVLERASGRGPDHRAGDFWGLAAVAWFALTGRPPQSPPQLTGELTGSARVLAGVLADCLVPDPGQRPRPEELRTLIWAAAEPIPIKLVDPSSESRTPQSAAGLPPISRQVTQRRGAPWPSAAGAASAGAGKRRRPRLTPRSPRRPVLVGLAGAGIMLGAAGLVLRLHDVQVPTPPGRRPVSETAQFSIALDRIGRARATAFDTLSQPVLLQADQADSPAEQADLALMRRLRQRGYHLEGVRYDVSQVQVLGRNGATVRLRAVVTTSGHRQVKTTSDVSAEVPPDGPRPVVFTVVPAPGAIPGAASWRVENVSAAT